MKLRCYIDRGLFMNAKYQFNKCDTDYFQFHLKDAETSETLKDAWTKDAIAKDLAVSKSILGIGTKCNTTVKITIEIFDTEPILNTKTNWRQILESEISLPSGTLVITSPTLEESSQQKIKLLPDIYCLRIYFGDEKIRGVHTYKIDFWRKNLKKD